MYYYFMTQKSNLLNSLKTLEKLSLEEVKLYLSNNYVLFGFDTRINSLKFILKNRSIDLPTWILISSIDLINLVSI